MPIHGLPDYAVGSHVVEYGLPWQGPAPVDAPSLLETATDGTMIRTESDDAPSQSSAHRRRRLKRLVRGLTRMFGSRASQHYTESNNDKMDESPPRRLIRPEEWRAYGYWARPYIRGVGIVRNSTPSSTSDDVDPDDAFGDLWGPRGSPHPERWRPIRGHPTLPPRPDGFETPRPGSPVPPPRDLQLNPYLRHRLVGMPTIIFDISMEPTAITFSETQNLIPLMPGDLAQPATFPLVTKLVIAAVADDAASSWPWPIRIYNPRGVKVEDVFDCIYENFQQFLTRDEYYGLTEKKRDLVTQALRERCKPASDNPYAPEYTDEGVRRYDYMVGRTLFRGLEPHPYDDAAWILFVGSH
ncbi:hypothetical protein GLOTRDRAFT_141354 [Gloeophyllum trabeum ATCC 11539]|uniref:DUF6699 domain-containing protein n=1 Tax=Gloeophyllum trabeum (strain ATCC 11539 / FP-39264 / Madison 617) TaxID=670483 RepID=S7R9C9_GLOTA|nr:uncharacterized protein GLOTRDRAFT_141354 [Gloeophyllum trabeum ATCC 11539]EPQ50885.1 hypothetical protein GLOTRDRAFT_141354 [Gloeophyllum trabeum ATCC 11539]